MLQGEYNPFKSKELSELVNRSVQKASEYVTDDGHKKELMNHAMTKSWDKLQLDDRKTMGYTYKTMGAGFYALRNSREFRKTIMELVMEGGDADTNGAVAGALMGCKFGFKKLPEDLLNFPHRKWLDKKIEKFLVTIGLVDMQPQEENKEQEDDKMEIDNVVATDNNVLCNTMEVTHSRDDVTNPPSDDVTNPPSDVTNPPSDDVTNPPSDVTNPPSNDVTNPPSDHVTNPSSDDVTNPLSDDVTNPPSDNVINPLGDDVTNPPNDHTSSRNDTTDAPSDHVTSNDEATSDDINAASNDVTSTPSDAVVGNTASDDGN